MGYPRVYCSFPVFISRPSFPRKSKKRHHSLFFAFFLPLERSRFWLFFRHCLFRYGRLQVELVFVASLDWSFCMLLVASDRFWSLLFPSFFFLWLCSDLYIWDTNTHSTAPRLCVYAKDEDTGIRTDTYLILKGTYFYPHHSLIISLSPVCPYTHFYDLI